MEMEEEVAFSVLFYDMDQVLLQALRLMSRGEENLQSKWALFLEIARKYEDNAITV